MAKNPKRTEGETNSSGTQNLTVQGISFSIPAPFREGHTLTATEAQALNGVYAENLRNNFAKTIKKAKKDHGDTLPEEVQNELRSNLLKYAESYQFHGRRSTRSLDPVTSEAQKIARKKIVEQAKAKNFDLKTLPEGRMSEMVAQLIEKNPAIREEAERRVNAVKEVGQIDFGLDL